MRRKRRDPITAFLVIYYAGSLIAVVFAWLKGGHPERLGALVTIAAYCISYYSHPLMIGDFYAGDAVLDLAMTGFFVWLSLKCDRWWPLAMTAVMALTLLVHGSSLVVPHVGGYADISARVGLSILSALILLSGTVERWLAGEEAISGRALWRARSRDDREIGRRAT